MYTTDNLKEHCLQTKELQNLIDKSVNDTLIIKGSFITGPLFIPSNSHIILDGELIATIDESNYSLISTRVAGIEMSWYPAILNIIDSTNVIIEGNGTINGNGEYWWNKYWGEDLKSGMRESYDKMGLRWACDYDCKRPRNLLIQNSHNITLKNITSYKSGFWNYHVLYSHDILIDSVKIKTINKESPSTDGIDIDSSYDVKIIGVETDCFDDSICIKSGRDLDGQRVNIACHDIEISNCQINKGFGITIGSEVSGGVYNINIHDINYNGTDCAFRIKSTPQRKGYIKNIKVSNLTLNNVRFAFHMYTNWNTSYNNCNIPNNYNKEIPEYWNKIITPGNGINTIIDGIEFNNINGNNISRVFNIEGFDDSHMKNIIFNKMNIKALEYGYIKNVDNPIFNNVDIQTKNMNIKENDSYDER